MGKTERRERGPRAARVSTPCRKLDVLSGYWRAMSFRKALFGFLMVLETSHGPPRAHPSHSPTHAKWRSPSRLMSLGLEG